MELKILVYTTKDLVQSYNVANESQINTPFSVKEYKKSQFDLSVGKRNKLILRQGTQNKLKQDWILASRTHYHMMIKADVIELIL